MLPTNPKYVRFSVKYFSFMQIDFDARGKQELNIVLKAVQSTPQSVINERISSTSLPLVCASIISIISVCVLTADTLAKFLPLLI